ncbi:MAG: ATP-binding protein [Pseudomonadota bacterium]
MRIFFHPGLALLLLLAGFISPAFADQGCGHFIKNAQRVATGEVADAGRVQQVALPDFLPRALRSERVHLRYTLDVAACASTPAAALWLFRVSAPYRVSADGQALALLNARALLSPEFALDSAILDDVHNGRIPALFALPPGAKQVEIELLTLPSLPSGIVRAEIGTTQQLLPVQASAAEFAVAYIDTASVMLLVISVIAFLLWLPRHSDRSLVWLAVACALWGVRGLVFFGHNVYLHPMAFEQFNAFNVLLTSSALSASIFSVLGGMRRLEAKAMVVALLLGLAAFLLAAWLGRGAAAARALSLFLPFCMVTWLLVRVWKARPGGDHWRNAALVAGIAVLLICGAHDLMLLAGVLAPYEPSYLFWGFVVFLMALALMSGHYTVLTLNRAERSNEELELHVARKSGELEHSYKLLRENETESARVQERERLLREMHDGLGAQLMTALRGVERGALSSPQIAQSLQDSLDELRLLMDSTDMGDFLPGALAAWRNRSDARLAAAGVSLSWHIDESLDEARLSSETVLQIMRLLQEAGANIVKHAQASDAAVKAFLKTGAGGEKTLVLEVTDNGVGMPPERADGPGRGLRNMRQRAQQLGGTLEIVSGAGTAGGAGTTVRLQLALPAR